MTKDFFILNKVILTFEAIGRSQIFLFNVLREMITPPFRFSLILKNLYFIGNQSLIIIVMTGFFTGAVFGLQIAGVFSIFKAEAIMGGATGIALATELAPLVTAFLLAGRVGSAITAEIATMVVTEQIEAIEAMGVEPIHYLVVPRIIASILIMPLLCGFFMFFGMFGCYLVGLVIYNIDQGVFMEQLTYLVVPNDIVVGLRKMYAFSFIISIIACYSGLNASGGAKGVGQATTVSVVKMLMGILLFDLFISYIEVSMKV